MKLQVCVFILCQNFDQKVPVLRTPGLGFDEKFLRNLRISPLSSLYILFLQFQNEPKTKTYTSQTKQYKSSAECQFKPDICELLSIFQPIICELLSIFLANYLWASVHFQPIICELQSIFLANYLWAFHFQQLFVRFGSFFNQLFVGLCPFLANYL